MLQQQSALPFIGILLWLQRIDTWPTPQQYHLINVSMTWNEAQQFCRVKYSDLATVRNMEDKIELDSKLDDAYAWIGLRRADTTRWVWSDGSGEAGFTKWKDGEPNNPGSGWCTGMSNKTTWIELDCDERRETLCYDRLGGGYKTFTHVSGERTWADSVEVCREKWIDLVTIENGAENSLLASAGQHMWIGLFKDSWSWSDGSKTSFRYWLKGSSHSGNCVSAAAKQRGGWIQSQCEEKSRFICQGDPKVKKMVIRMKVTSDVALNSLAINNALLQELDRPLRLQNVTDFKLSWQKDPERVTKDRKSHLSSSQGGDESCP